MIAFLIAVMFSCLSLIALMIVKSIIHPNDEGNNVLGYVVIGMFLTGFYWFLLLLF